MTILSNGCSILYLCSLPRNWKVALWLQPLTIYLYLDWAFPLNLHYQTCQRPYPGQVASYVVNYPLIIDFYFWLFFVLNSIIFHFSICTYSIKTLSRVYTYRYSPRIDKNEYLSRILAKNNWRGSHLRLFVKRMFRKCRKLFSPPFSRSQNTVFFPRMWECIAKYGVTHIHTYHIRYSFSPILGK